MEYRATRQFAQECDKSDLLAGFRDEFRIPDTDHGTKVIYLCGNSLGLQPLRARDYVEQELDAWGTKGVEGHFTGRHPWLPYHEFLTASLSRVVGAKPIETVAMNTLTVNLHLMLVSFYRPDKKRFKILCSLPAFPSDRYAVDSQIRYHGMDPQHALICLQPRDGESIVSEDAIEEALAKDGDAIALVLLDGVNYYSGQALDIARITKAAHKAGCFAGFDLAHAAGNLELKLHDWGPDFAVWCSYKYLNGGPGCVAGAFVHERHAHDKQIPRFAGWWGHNKDTRFLMGPKFEPLPGCEGWQLSNPPILPLAALRASLELFDRAGMAALRKKSVNLTGYLEFLVHEFSAKKVRIATPSDAHRRGCQLSLEIAGSGGRAIFEFLQNGGAICDWREPNVIRVAPAPLYNSFMDVFRFAELLQEALDK